MYGLFSPSPQRPGYVSRNLLLESLETRDCPSTFIPTQILPVDLNAAAAAQQTNGPAGPYTVTISHTVGAGQTINVTGAVTGTNPGGQMVEFEGPISGFVISDPDGTFSFSTQASSLGTVEAGVIFTPPSGGTLGGTGLGGLVGGGSLGGPGGGIGLGGPVVESNVASDTLVDTGPTITNFTAVQLSAGNWEFMGQVQGTYAQGLTVNFGGEVAALQGTYATVDSQGDFALFITMSSDPSNTGLATAQIFADPWDLSSNMATTYV